MRKLAHGLVGALAFVGFLTLAACTPSATPAPGAASPGPTAAAAPKPTEAATPTSKPALSTPSAPKPAEATPVKPAASADWKAEWDKTVAAAKKEGKVVVAGGAGELYRKAAMSFQPAYPEITLEFTGINGSDFGPKITAEREAGQFLWDLHSGGGTTMLTVLKPKGALDPLKPALLLPDLLEDSKWLGGSEGSWVDKERQYVFEFEGRLRPVAYANRDLAPESQLNSMDQLLDPKWKGKLVFQDPRLAGPQGPCFGYLYALKGEEWLRKLWAQDPIIVKDGRQAVESVVRGTVPIGMCLDSAQLENFVQQGVAGHVKPVDTVNVAGVQLTSGFGNVVLINRAPHPNAAKVYINWLLSQDGQKAYVAATNLNSRRLDVQGPAATAPDPKVKYQDMQKEEYLPNLDAAKKIATEVFK